MARWCNICDQRGHNTSECWYKRNFLKEITREDGKWKKKYTLPNLEAPNKRYETRNVREPIRNKSRTPTTPRRISPTPTGTRPKQKSEPSKTNNHGNKTPPRSHETKMGEVQVMEIIKQPTASTSCKECLKWDMRMQHTLKYQEETRNDDKRIIKSITDENMTLRKEIMKLKQERDCFKKLFEINKK